MAFSNILLMIYIIIGYQSCNFPSTEESETSISGAKNTPASNSDLTVLEKPSNICEIPLPEGYYRENADSLSFANYLRNLPLDTVDNNIYSYNGAIISEGGYHYAIIKMDIGTKDIQQCADAVMRLRAEYLYSLKRYNQIHFNFLSDGKPRYFSDFSKGDNRYKTFRKYMEYIFSYANTSSLKDELIVVSKLNEMAIGDVFIQKGNPIGHAVIVVDMAVEKKSGKKIFLVAQSYMPAQSIHILSNKNSSDLDPWYPSDFEDELELPSWTFTKKDLRRFK